MTQNSFTVYVAADHGGFHLKEAIVAYLHKLGQNFQDLGVSDSKSVDYPDYAKKVAELVSKNPNDRGILICGSGMGMAITANKFKGVRAAAVSDLYCAKMTRLHNNLNVLCLGERVIGVGVAQEIVELFLKTPFEGGRHSARVDKISACEK